MSKRGSSISKRYGGASFGPRVTKASFNMKRYKKSVSKINKLYLQFNKVVEKFGVPMEDENSVLQSILARKVFVKLSAERRKHLVDSVDSEREYYTSLLTYVQRCRPTK